MISAARSSIIFVDNDSKNFFFFLTEAVCFRIPLDSGVCGWVYKTGKVANVKDAYSDQNFNKTIDYKSGFTTKNILAAPISHGGSCVAVLQFLNKLDDKKNEDPAGFSEYDEMALLDAAAKLSAVVRKSLDLANAKIC